MGRAISRTMKKPLWALLLGLTVLITTAWAAKGVEKVPLLALRMARQGFENTIWMEQRTKIGTESVSGYIQGTGGGDDALMGFELDEEWDVLDATIGYLATSPEGRSAEFTVEANGAVLYTSGPIESKGQSSKIRVPLRGNKKILLRITAERYNGTAGAAWGAPMLLRNLPAGEIESSWSLQFEGAKSPLNGVGAPREVLVPLAVPGEGTHEKVYTYKVRRDPETRTVIVERTELPSE